MNDLVAKVSQAQITRKGNAISQPPLWKGMEPAYFEGRSPGPAEGPGYAAEIRAIRDWLFANLGEPGPKATADAYAAWEERKTLHALLTAESNRALFSEN